MVLTEILGKNMNLKDRIDIDIFRLIGNVADSMKLETYVVGGYVRALIMQRPSTDIDIVTVGSGIELAKAIADIIPHKKNVSVFKNFGTAMIHYQSEDKDWQVEFVGARKESYRRDSRKPIVEDGTLEDDQNRRDFTINAMAISLNEATFGDLIDPFDGLFDIRRHIIRTPLDPDITFSDDPLRMMRCIRFATQLDFSIMPETFEAIERNKERIHIISQERITEEINKIMLSRFPSKGWQLLDRCGLLQIIFPEVSALKGVESVGERSHKDNFKHTMEVLDKGKRMAEKIFRRMKLPMTEPMKYVQKLIFLHLRPIALVEDVVTDSAVRRLLFEAGDDIDDLMILCHSDITSKNMFKKAKYMENLRLVKRKMAEIEEKDRIRNFKVPVSGEEIMQMYGLEPCKTVGILKDKIKDSILDGIIPNDRQASLELLDTEAKKLGLNRVNV